VCSFSSGNFASTCPPCPSLQVISQFAKISSSTGSGSYPEPAKTFVSALSMTNLEVFGFVPLSCVVSGATFYDTVLVKCSGIPCLIGLLWCFFPLRNKLRGMPTGAAARFASKLSLLLLEVSLPSISTSLVQVFLVRDACALSFIPGPSIHDARGDDSPAYLRHRSAIASTATNICVSS
jgi:hypothetical protein